MTRLAVILLLTLLLPQLASAKRIAPVKVDPVIYQGIRYVAPNDDGHRGYIEAWNVGTNKKLWELTLFANRIDPNLEEDVRLVFIKALSIHDGRLMVTSERGKTYQSMQTRKRSRNLIHYRCNRQERFATCPTQSKEP